MQQDNPQSISWQLREAGYVPGAALVVGVSGGADSMALLHRLMEVIDPAALHVAHLDHGMRENSQQDVKFVAEIAAGWRLPFHAEKVDVPELARSAKKSVEDAARWARYDFLAAVAQSVGASVVAVGHHADDQAETVLLHFLRGAGLGGLRGMRLAAPFPGAPNLTLVRPLLGQTRDEIEVYCAAHELPFLHDLSNRDPAYTRNRIRHQLLPQLAAFNPQIKQNLLRLAKIAAADDDVLIELTAEIWPELVAEAGPGWLRLHRRRWQEQSLSIQRRTLRRAVQQINAQAEDLSFESIELAAEIARKEGSGLATTLPSGVVMLVDYDNLLFTVDRKHIPAESPQLSAPGPLTLSVPGEIELSGSWRLKARRVELMNNLSPRAPDSWHVLVDLPGCRELQVRARRPGERMQPLGMDGHSAALQDIMVNRKIPARLRVLWPLVATDAHAVWLIGHGIDHRARVTTGSQNLVALSCERAEISP